MSIVKIALFASQNIFFIIIGLFGIGFLIGFHELGHFLFCKLFGVKTPSFSIGFGPRLIQRKIGDTVFTLSAIPLGGYVEIAGSAEVGQGEQKEARSVNPDSFAAKPYYQKLLIMIGGIMFNLAFAYTAFIAICMFGLPNSPILYPFNANPIIQTIAPEGAAAQADLRVGDRIVSLDSTQFQGNTLGLLKAISAHPGKSMQLTIERNGTQKTIPIIIGTQQRMGKTVGSLGVIFTMQDQPGLNPLAAVKKGIKLANSYIKQTFLAFKHIFAKADVSSVGGPLSIIQQTIKGAEKGIKVFLALLAIISINLAILNLIPLPILDGGQILFYTIETIIRRPLPEKVRMIIHIATWIGFLILFIYLTAQDILRMEWVKSLTGMVSK